MVLYSAAMKAQTITEDQMAQLVATALANQDDSFRCETCLKLPAPGAEAAVEARRKVKGCWGPGSMVENSMARGVPRAQAERGAGYTVMEMVRFAGCPGNFHTPWAASVLRLWFNYRNGILPEEGGFLDQPAWLLDAFSVLDKFEAKRLEEKNRKDGN